MLQVIHWSRLPTIQLIYNIVNEPGKVRWIMKIKVNLLAAYRLITDTKELTLEVPEGITVDGVVENVLWLYPKLRQHWMDEHGDLYVHVHIYLNKDDITTLPLKLDTLVKENDEFDFIPPVAGG